MYMYIGASLRTLFEDEKSALLQQIDTEFEKVFINLFGVINSAYMMNLKLSE